MQSRAFSLRAAGLRPWKRVLSERFGTVLNEEDKPLKATALAEALRDFDAVLPTVSDRLPASLFRAVVSARKSSAISASTTITSTLQLHRLRASS